MRGQQSRKNQRSQTFSRYRGAVSAVNTSASSRSNTRSPLTSEVEPTPARRQNLRLLACSGTVGSFLSPVQVYLRLGSGDVHLVRPPRQRLPGVRRERSRPVRYLEANTGCTSTKCMIRVGRAGGRAYATITFSMDNLVAEGVPTVQPGSPII